jgi:ribosomal protein L18E
MATKTQINKNMKRKTNMILAEAIFLAKKNNLIELASKLSLPTKKQATVNLDKINKSKAEIIIIPGKVLSGGEMTRKCKVYALKFSKPAEEKLKKTGCEIKKLIQILRENKKVSGEIIT